MLKFNKIKKSAANVYNEIIKHTLLFSVIISFFDLYFYLWENKTENLFVEIRIFVAVAIIIIGIYDAIKPLWTYYCFKTDNRKEPFIMFDLESVFEMPPVKQEYVKPLKIIDPKIEEFAHLLQANDHEIKKLVLFKLKDYLKKQEPCPPMDDVIKCEMLPLLVKALMSNDSTIQMYAANIIAYIAKWNEEYIPDIIEADAIPSFIQILKCDRQVAWNLMTEKDAAVYGLVQICRKENYRDLCIQQGIIKPLISFINSIANIKFLPDSYSNNVSALITCLCRPYNAQTSSENAQLLLPELNKLSQNLNNGVILNVIILIREFLEGGPKYTELLIDFEVFELVFDGQNFQNLGTNVYFTAYAVFLDFISIKMEHIQHLIDCGILFATAKVFSASDPQAKKLIIFFLSEIISAGEESYIDDIIEANFVQLFISLQDDGNIDLEVHRNALEFLSNILKFGNFDHALILFEDHFISSIRDLLNHDDSGVKEMTLHCIKNLLEKLSSDYANDARQEIINCGLLVKIKQLQMSPKLCKAANEVMAVFLHAN